MELSVIIVNWNTRDLLAQCLESVYANPPNGEFEIIVVDNGSSDGSVDMVRERFPEVLLIENLENTGFARANNQAIRISAGRYIQLLNSDAMVTPDSLEAMATFMDFHPQAGVVGPMLINRDGSFQASFAEFPTLWTELCLLTGISRLVIGPYAPSPRPKLYAVPEQVDWVAGAAIMVRRAAIDRVGLMDETYAFYSEETDWCWRMNQWGWQVWYIPLIKVYHIGAASSRKRSHESYIQLYDSKVRFFKTAYGPRAANRLRFVIKVMAFLRLTVRALMLPITTVFSKSRTVPRIQQDIALIRHMISSD